MLKIKDLKKSYGSFALDCSMEIPKGCITGLIGANGAGKSTTIKAVLGLIAADSGSIELLGKDQKALRARDKEQLGVVLSDAGFSEWLTLKEIVSVLAGMYTKFDREWFVTACERYALSMNKQLKEFSTGMKAKVKILTALSHKARFLVLDEPTVGLDVLARDEVLQLLREYMEQQQDASILISSHISTDLEGLCDDLYMIDGGKIVLHETMDALLEEYALLKLTKEQYAAADRQYFLRIKEENYGYVCLTNQKQFYLENYPQFAIEKGGIDEVLTLMVKGECA